MKRTIFAAALVGVTALYAQAAQWSIVMHGGAGVIRRETMKPGEEEGYRKGLSNAMDAAAAVLGGGGPALDAVEAAIKVLEDDPLFNAGRGAVFTAEGRNEMDAALMEGASLRAGSVAGVTRVRHPISDARAVMEKTPHVMLIGPAADKFAGEAGLEIVDPSYFFTERRWQDLERTMHKAGKPMPPRPAGVPPQPSALLAPLDPHHLGTVGIAVLDSHGNLAAGTSTGGVTGKRPGRVGDTPIIGAGTYASNQSCAVSGTGTGEFFIRLTVAREICALVQYRGMPIQQAADEVIQRRLTALKGDGGVIAVDTKGNGVWSFNTPGMYRARLRQGGTAEIAIYK